MVRAVFALGAVVAVPVWATTCVWFSPCASIGPDSIVFIGNVVSVQPMENPVRESLDYRTVRARVEVRELFVGLAEGTEVVIVEAGDWLKPGKDILFDVFRRESGTYGLRVCGRSDEVDEANEFLRYLRSRKKGLAQTSLSVDVRSSYVAVSGAEVVVSGPKGEHRTKTGRDGQAIFKGIPPGKYSVQVSKPNFRMDSQEHNDNTVEVLDQACPTARLHLRSSATVSGVLRSADGQNVEGVDVELVNVEHENASYEAKTDAEGVFRFENVVPGRYLLGTNIRYESIATGNIQRAYYPGRPTRSGAAEIAVGKGVALAGLQFTLPDAGPRRPIQICVVDESGKPVAGARIMEAWRRNRDVRYGALDPMTAGENGCAVTDGYERAAYTVTALAGNLPEFRSSGDVDIPPAKGPASLILVVRRVRR